jgi:hypothetical protein
MSVHWSVSFKDVELVQAQSGSKGLERTLYRLGMDIRQGWMDDGRWKLQQDIDHSVPKDKQENVFGYHHRSLSGHKVCGPRYIGVARQDGKWRSLISNELNLTAEFGMGSNS